MDMPLINHRLKKSKYSKALSIQKPVPCPAGGGCCTKVQIKEFYEPIFSAVLIGQR